MTTETKITGRRWKVGDKVKFKVPVGLRWDEIWKYGTIVKEIIGGKYPRGAQYDYFVDVGEALEEYVDGNNLRVWRKK